MLSCVTPAGLDFGALVADEKAGGGLLGGSRQARQELLRMPLTSDGEEADEDDEAHVVGARLVDDEVLLLRVYLHCHGHVALRVAVRGGGHTCARNLPRSETPMPCHEAPRLSME